MQTTDTKNAEVEEEERLTAEKEEKTVRMEVGNDKRKEKVIKKKTVEEGEDERERLGGFKTGKKLTAPAVAATAA
ncbi:hypothetical protein CesoFtcFv8_009571 [Champsocephalus esox]|uniref:Uncharacterized protein n=1 Tax=Champsocephalus esox TaxID=159716 RepID=A0AAN8H2L2_9TELE|nr:hypothetical protein CesoFtcFv8_009571 [Champsocephalus esox]